MIKILVVDDSALVRRLFGRVFADQTDFDVSFARNGFEALDKLKTFQPDVITLDVHMPDMDGLACLDRIMVERPSPVVMVSSVTRDGAEITLEALRLGAVDFVGKPEGPVSLHMQVFGPQLIGKVRAAATVKLKSSLRLRERIQNRIGARTAPLERPARGDGQSTGSRAKGAGLVVVGASTGGPTALEALLTPLSATFPWPTVIAQHMPASFTGALARRLDKICAVTVSEVTEATVLQPGCAYVGRGDGDVIIRKRGTALIAAPARLDDYPWHPSTDRLVRSAMEQLSACQIVGVLMTGMGDDGAQAMAHLRALGGRTIAESQETAVVWGMPGELVKAGGADWIVPVHQIAKKLQELVPYHAASPLRTSKKLR